MKKMDTRRRIRVISLLLFVVMFSVWLLFYFIISGYIADNTRKQMTLAAEQIIERLGNEFSQAEKVLYSLKRSADVKALVDEQDPEKYLPLMKKISDGLNMGMSAPDFLEHIILFGSETNYYRLAGSFGNRSCTRLYEMVAAAGMPNYLPVDLGGRKYICYADGILSGGSGEPDYAVILIAEEKILEILRAYDQSGSLLVAVKAVNGEVVAANTDWTDLLVPTADDEAIVKSRLGITPYEITVTARPRYIDAQTLYFTIAALITALIFGVVLYTYTDVLNRRFFRPMVKVADSIESLNTEVSTETIPHVRSEEFDGLIDKINEMLMNIDRKNRAVKNAEIEKQKALVFSLKKQINAHFTINTLNTIRMFAEQKRFAQAETVSRELIALIRYAYGENELINIWDEQRILQSYLFIMNSRYDGKLTADFDFDDRLMKYDMPRMLLQPIIENAIVHGFSAMDSGCFITVRAVRAAETACFTVSDNGRGMGTGALAALKDKLSIRPEALQGFENIALLNIKNRLYYYYGTAGRLDLRRGEGGGLTVSVEIPLHPESREGFPE